MVATMPSVTDQAVENAQYQLRQSRMRLKQAEQGLFCCDQKKNFHVGQERKQVKRWENWLADRDILTGDSESEGDDED